MEEANTQMRLLEALKKEFRLTRILWRQIFDEVTGHERKLLSGLCGSASRVLKYIRIRIQIQGLTL